MKRILSVQGLRKAFGSVEVLRGVDLDVSEGETIAIIGPSGSGKSTLLRCLNRLEVPTAGVIEFEGAIITEKTNHHRMRASMGMVFQQFNLFPHMTVLGNIIEAPVHVLKIPEEQAVARARALLQRVGLADKERAWPSQLSGGQRQRVAIARSLAMEPKLLLLDEITSALDPELVGEVLNVIRKLADQGMTMLIVTHEMAFARDVSDRVIFMDHGLVVEEGPPDQIFSRPREPRLAQFLHAVIDRAAIDSRGAEPDPSLLSLADGAVAHSHPVGSPRAQDG